MFAQDKDESSAALSVLGNVCFQSPWLLEEPQLRVGGGVQRGETQRWLCL